MTSIKDRIAAAPISWGVCEVPGWGHQMQPSRVLQEMAEVGVVATELGPQGFLPDDPSDAARLLAEYGMSAVGGFLPLVLFDDDSDPLTELRPVLEAFGAADASTLVVAAATGQDGYDTRPTLNDAQWATLLANLDRVSASAAERGIVTALHPHVGTMIENKADVDRIVAESGVGLCLDTGHLLVGGSDPAQIVGDVPDRICHTHLKDVDVLLAADVQAGRLTYTEAVRRGLYRRLGEGNVDIAGIVRSLEANGYQGWYVMEQDTVLEAEPPAGQGPINDVRHGYQFLCHMESA